MPPRRAVDNLVDGADDDIAVNAEFVNHEESQKQDEQQPDIEAPETSR